MTYALKRTIKNRFNQTQENYHRHRYPLQSHLWLNAPFVESIEINPEEYEDDMLVSTITFKNTVADDFPVSCNCLKCATKKRLSLSCETKP